MHRVAIVGILLFAAGCGRAQSTEDWLQQLKHFSAVKRRQAIRELGAQGTRDERVAPALVAALHDENVYVRRDAAITLANLSSPAKDVVPALWAALKDKKRSVRKAAARSLQRISNPQPAPSAGFN